MTGLGRWWESRKEHGGAARQTRMRALFPAGEDLVVFANYKIARSSAPMGIATYALEMATDNAPRDSLAGSFPPTPVGMRVAVLTSRRLAVVTELVLSKPGAKVIWEIPRERLRQIRSPRKRLLQFCFDDGTAVKVVMRVGDIDKFLQAASR